MSVVAMKKLTLVGLLVDKGEIFDTFNKLNCVDLIKMEEIENTSKKIDVVESERLVQKKDSLKRSMDFISQCVKLKNKFYSDNKKDKNKTLKLNKTVDISFDDFLQINTKEFEIFNKAVDNTLKNEARYNEILSEVAKEKAILNSLKVYLGMDMPFSEIQDTKNTNVLLGTVANIKVNDLEKLLIETPEAQFGIINKYLSDISILVAFHNIDKEIVMTKLSKMEFSRCNLSYNLNPSEKTNECNNIISQLEKEKEHIIKQTAGLEIFIDELKVLYDYFKINIEKVNADGGVCKTQSTFVCEAWVPFDETSKVSEALDKVTEATIKEYSDPLDEENPPTKLKNIKIVQPFEQVTNMYSVPNYREKDPNNWVAFFYFLYFGIIVGDAGYGLILALGGFIVLKLMRFNKGTRDLIIMFTYGGISTLIWGAMFGGWFGITNNIPIFQPILFNPLENPLLAIGMCLGLGVIQIMVGLALSGMSMIREKRYGDSFFDAWLWFIFFVGILCMAGGMVLEISIVSTIGLIIMGTMLVTTLLFNGRHKKGILGKIVSGVVGLYGVVNYASDILSYLRLFGLCLASSVVAMVFNIIAELFFNSWVTVIVGVVVMIFGHTLNLALNLLGAYVHDSRLQHIEFFSKFYTGEGILFKPFASETKYTNIIK